MDRLQAMAVFVAVAEAGSFARAAAALRRSPPAVTRAVAALEERLGVRLIQRTTRRLRLTEAGLRYLESAKRLLAEVEEAERAAAGETAIPTGHLRLTASLTFGRLHLAPVVAGFLRAQPRVSASLVLLDRVANLVEEGFDAAVRIAHLPPDSALVARRLGEVRRLLVASPSYLAARGAPERPEELKRHELIAFIGLVPAREWRFVEAGRPLAVPLTPRFEVNDSLAALAAAERGEGITVALSYVAAPLLAEGRLVPLLEPFLPPPVPVQLVYPQARLLAAKLRAFVDHAVPRLKAQLAGEGAPLAATAPR